MIRLASVTTYWRLLARYLRPQWRRVALLAVLLVAVLGLQLASPWLLGRFVDQVTGPGEQQLVPTTALLFLAAALLGQLLYAPAAYLTHDVSWTATNALRTDLMLHSLRLDMTFHKTHTPGEMIERIDGDVAELANFFSQFLIQVVANAVLLAGIVTVLFVQDWRLGAVIAGYVMLALAALLRFQGRAVPHFTRYRAAVSELSGFWEEALTATEDMRASGARPYLLRRNLGLLRSTARLGRRAVLMFRAFVGAIAAVFVVGTAVAFMASAYLYSIGAITIGAIFMVLSYTILLTENLRRITDQLGDLQRAAGSIERVHQLQQRIPAVQDGPGAALPAGPLAVAVENVSFEYTADRAVLHEVDLRLAPGEVLGVLGRTGSGKTTLARLLFRFYDPTQGRITLDGVPVREARLAQLRRRVAMVTQDVQLFHATVRDNVTLFDPATPDGRVLATFAELGLDNWFRRLPDGLDTVLEGGSRVSAGEAQLLALVRAFLTDPGLVVLDEASSRLDPATERMIEGAIDRLLADRTAVVIAHRLATIRRVDSVLILERGRVVEYGRYGELAATPESRLRALLRSAEGSGEWTTV